MVGPAAAGHLGERGCGGAATHQKGAVHSGCCAVAGEEVHDLEGKGILVALPPRARVSGLSKLGLLPAPPSATTLPQGGLGCRHVAEVDGGA